LLGVAYSCERGGSDNTPTARGKEQDAMARTVLVSFLGKGIRATEEQPRSHLGYRTARYDFTHLGGSDEESAMFGLALLRHLRTQNQKPNVWLVLGSPQSSWDALIEAVDIEALDSQQMETLNALFQRVEEAVKQEETHPSSKGSDFLTETLLQEWARTLTMHLHPTQVRCFLIGWSYDRAEQEQLWKILSEQTEEQDRLILDITHGFRHQPMLTAFIVTLLNRLKRLSAVEFYYGALDMTPKTPSHTTQNASTPVLKIDFVNDLIQATEALATYQETGDYEPLANFALQGNAKTQVRNLIFEQRVNKTHLSALQPAITALKSFRASDSLRASLVPLILQEAESLREGALHQRLVRQADKAMEHDNYMVAIPLLWEAVLSLACQLTGSGSPEEYQSREKAESVLIEKPNHYLTDKERGDLLDLRDVRNAVVHGTRRSKRPIVKSALSSKERMKQLFDQAREIYDRLNSHLLRG
jgi:cell division protein DivIC